MKVLHLTSVHPRYDTRIFYKECSTLADSGHDVTLIVADGLGNEDKANVHFVDVGKPVSRIKRMLRTTKVIYEIAKSMDADIYHIHDPELIPSGVKLKNSGKKVIFDAHESVSSQILSKSYLPKPIRSLLSFFYAKYERLSVSQFDAIVAATSHIKNEFERFCERVVEVKNYPLLDEFIDIPVDSKKESKCVYLGSLDEPRGIREIVAALDLIENVDLTLAGRFGDCGFEQELARMPGWQKVNFLGFINREQAKSALAQAQVGLVTLHKTENYMNGLPVKLFEYMSAGLPVIASDIPLWREIIEQADCGLCVDPRRPQEIADALSFIFQNPERAKVMGENGRNAVINHYNWKDEAERLTGLYSILNKHV